MIRHHLALTVTAAVLAAAVACSSPGESAEPVGDLAVTTSATTVPDTGGSARDTPPGDRADCGPGEASAAVHDRVASMSRRQKIGQLLMPQVRGGTSSVSEPLVDRWAVGGVIHLEPDRPVAAITAGLQRAADRAGLPGLLVAVDQEGGVVQRVGAPVPPLPAAAAFGGVGDPVLTEEATGLVAAALSGLGVNVNLAPVADVVRRSGGVIGSRSYGSGPGVVAPQVAAAVRGIQGAGVVATVKHFPGHGDTTVDSHATMPVVTTPAAVWERVDRPPFEAALDEGVCLVMTGHVWNRALDPYEARPATLSPVVVRGWLRDRLGFDGAVMSDSLLMGGVRAGRSDADVAVLALRAGVDVLLMPPEVGATVVAVEAALDDGRLTERRLEHSVVRVLALKEWLGLPL